MLGELTAAARVLRRDRSGAALLEVIRAATAPYDASDVAELAAVLADSGERSGKRDDAVDVASTGGPGSLSTLVTSPVLVSKGAAVPKISVPGRPAGAIDVLGTIPGYRVSMSRVEFEAVLRRSGHAHVLAGRQWVPADAQLFDLRQRTGAQSEPALAAASLLSKKVAAGVSGVVLDVRVGPHGNFGSDRIAARRSAELFVRAAALLGLAASAVLSDSFLPRQPWIGRGEALVALQEVLDDRAGAWLAQHVHECKTLTSEAAALVSATPVGTAASRGEVLGAFIDHLEAQGSSERAWRERAADVTAADRTPVPIGRAGHLTLDVGRLRSALVDAQRFAPGGASFPDPAGVLLTVRPGDWVESGRTVAWLRSTGRVPSDLLPRVRQAFDVCGEQVTAEQPPEIMRGRVS